MARLLGVLTERKKIRDDYKRSLEDSYIAKKREEELRVINGNREKLT
jgi:hypothetical protein